MTEWGPVPNPLRRAAAVLDRARPVQPATAWNRATWTRMLPKRATLFASLPER